MDENESGQIEQVLKESRKHGEILARLDERSLNQGQRLDRVDRRATVFGTIGGVIATAISYALKSIGWPSA